jgi:hypothetical protein
MVWRGADIDPVARLHGSVRVSNVFEFPATEVFEAATERSDNFFFYFCAGHMLRIYAFFDHGEVRVGDVSPVDFRRIKRARLFSLPGLACVRCWSWDFLVFLIPLTGVAVLTGGRTRTARGVQVAAAILCLSHLNLTFAAFSIAGVTFAPSKFVAHPNILR